MQELSYTISSPCEPSSGELIISANIFFVFALVLLNLYNTCDQTRFCSPLKFAKSRGKY